MKTETPLRERIFDSPREKKFLNFYRKLFSIEEIENSKALLWVYGATLLSYFVTFSSWALSPALSKQSVMAGTHSCWDYYQSCGDWHIFDSLPFGYSQTTFYMFIFGLLVSIVILLKKNEYVLAHMLTVPLFIWHFLGLFVLTSSFGGNYEYFLITFAFILLFIPHKEWFFKVSLVLFYFLASTIKIHETWVLGTYFTAMKTGAPFVPDWLVPIAMNLTILAQMVFAWFIFSKNKILRNIMIIYFLVFHFYSGILVGFKYPSVVLPTFIIIYILFYRWQSPPVDKKSIAGWILMLMLFLTQFISILIPGDERLTMEGNKYGLYMFEANHQCISTINVVEKDGEETGLRTTSESARNRCDPYKYMFRLKNTYCKLPSVKEINWTFDHSINGGPFLRIVETDNVCDLDYKAFTRNQWIKTEKDNPEIIGYPVENWYK